MPNWVKNVVTFYGDEKRIEEVREFTRNGDREFDFNTLAPMPEELKLVEGSESDKAIEIFMDNDPTTAKISYMYKYKIDEDEYLRLYNLGEKYVSNKMKYGHRSWYGWCCEHWGTKWNSAEPEWTDANRIEFLTAWSAPEPIFAKLAEKFPDVTFMVAFADEDIGQNCGELHYKDGKLWGVNLDPDNSYEFAKNLWGYEDEDEE
jgi:hypothetical protein